MEREARVVEETSSKAKTFKNPLIDKWVHVKLIKRKGSWLEDVHEHHDGANLWSGSHIGFKGLPFSPIKGRMLDPLTKEERNWFESPESGLGLKENDMSVLKESNFWYAFSISVTRNGLSLYLGEVIDYLRYKFLLVQPQIAPSWDERFEKADYKFAIVDKEIEDKKRVEERDKKSRANRAFGRMEHSKDKMSDFLNAYYSGKKMTPRDASTDFLIAEVDKILEEDIVGFLKVIEDPSYDMKVFIGKCINKGLVFKESKTKYKLVGEDDIFRLSELVEFMKDSENQIIYGKLKAQLEI